MANNCREDTSGGQKNEMPKDNRDPSGQALKVLNMESKTYQIESVTFSVFFVFSVLGGIGWYMMVLNCFE